MEHTYLYSQHSGGWSRKLWVQGYPGWRKAKLKTPKHWAKSVFMQWSCIWLKDVSKDIPAGLVAHLIIAPEKQRKVDLWVRGRSGLHSEYQDSQRLWERKKSKNNKNPQPSYYILVLVSVPQRKHLATSGFDIYFRKLYSFIVGLCWACCLFPQFPRCLVCLPCAISFPVVLLVRSTEANASVFPCFRMCAVITTTSPSLAGDINLKRKHWNIVVR